MARLFNLTFVIVILLFFFVQSLADEDINVNLGVNPDGTIEEEEEIQPTQQPTHRGIKIKNPRPYKVDYYWWDPSTGDGIFQGWVRGYGETATNSYVGHIFYITLLSQPDKEIFRFEVNSEENLYLIPPDSNEKMTEQSKKVWNKMLEEKQFMIDYKRRTGRPWLAYYPRKGPILPMWSADYIGQIHKIDSNESYWICVPEKDTPEERERCHPKETVHFEIEVISTEPKVFKIEKTLSDIESDFIIKIASNRLKRSRAGQDGGLESTTRTSWNTWIPRRFHFIMETMYRRAADILQLDEKILWSHLNVEDLQVLNYKVGQEYTPHHDFGAEGRPNQRMITLLYYLNNQSSPNAGGETSFPKAKNGYLKVHPGKGNSILFYSLLEDGNADDLALHAALPVNEGEKWLCNFWVWDPSR